MQSKDIVKFCECSGDRMVYEIISENFGICSAADRAKIPFHTFVVAMSDIRALFGPFQEHIKCCRGSVFVENNPFLILPNARMWRV